MLTYADRAVEASEAAADRASKGRHVC
jgi:hypothetical protein